MAGTAHSIQIENQSVNNADIIRLGPGEYIVRSRSNPAIGHTVVGDWCSCKGFMYRGRCRHVNLARGYESAVQCGIAKPNAEEIEYYRVLEDLAEERSKRGLPLSPP